MSILWIPGLLLLQVEPSAATGDGDPFALMAVGLGVVFTALAVVGLFLNFLGKLTDRLDEQTNETGNAVESVIAPITDEGVIDAKTVAILSAAAFAAIGRPVRVQRIRLLQHTTTSAWAGAGRTSVQSSHNIRRSL
jgi:Na+-transporting methylmalonyl-CoA/oxaloacetate decarboxylase gamma subunit